MNLRSSVRDAGGGIFLMAFRVRRYALAIDDVSQVFDPGLVEFAFGFVALRFVFV